MADFIPYYTQDGSVGLYSNEFNDIYHSVFGAYSEAYEKFILPAKFNEFFNNNKNIKILDICYGIGYNTKSFLNYFFEKILAKNKKSIFSKNAYIDKIDTNNISDTHYYNDTIDTNNILDDKDSNYSNKSNFKNKFSPEILATKLKNTIFSTVINKNRKLELENNQKQKYNIQIDAFDINETLMKLSPLINTQKKGAKIKLTKIKSVDKYLKKCEPTINSKYEYHNEINYIILMNLLDKYASEYLDNSLRKLLKDKKYKQFFRQDLSPFIQFYISNKGNYTPKVNKCTFLHNIYYRYISTCYKNTLEALKLATFKINFFSEDARHISRNEFYGYDYIFLDAFTPAKAPSLWSYDFFNVLFNKLNEDGMIITYSNSASIRNAFLKNKFYVGKIYNKSENKFTGTIATKNPKLIEYPLDNYDMGLINSKAGIVFKDTNLNLSNEKIISNRELEMKNSNLISSSKFIKQYKEKNNEI